jgi:hypothetical protein
MKKIVTPVQSDLGTHDAIQSPYGDWRLHEISTLDFTIEVTTLLMMIEYQEVVNFSDIAFKGRDNPLSQRRENCICCNGERYKNCDPSFPGILVKDCPNPFDLPYRLVDGKHRVERAIARGQTKSLFNVITYNRVKLELKPALTKWEEQNHDSR